MISKNQTTDECFILVKAQPHRTSKYFETVCCAGVGRDGKWRRQYPVPFRILDDRQKFGRWCWITYTYTQPTNDMRIESQKVVPESIKLGDKLKKSERSRFLNPLVRRTLADADARGESLALVRPVTLSLRAFLKTPSEIERERQKHANLASQLSMFDKEARPLNPCPVRFVATWTDEDGRLARHACDDWETSTAYMRFERQSSHDNAVAKVKDIYERQYLSAGLVLAFSTHSRRNVTNQVKNQWLLVGILRLDKSGQGDLLLR